AHWPDEGPDSKNKQRDINHDKTNASVFGHQAGDEPRRGKYLPQSAKILFDRMRSLDANKCKKSYLQSGHGLMVIPPIGLCGEFEIISDSGSERFFVDNCCRGGVFDCYTGAIENDDLGFASASSFLACNNFGELRVNIFFSHQTFRDCVMRVADR